MCAPYSAPSKFNLDYHWPLGNVYMYASKYWHVIYRRLAVLILSWLVVVAQYKKLQNMLMCCILALVVCMSNRFLFCQTVFFVSLRKVITLILCLCFSVTRCKDVQTFPLIPLALPLLVKCFNLFMEVHIYVYKCFRQGILNLVPCCAINGFLCLFCITIKLQTNQGVSNGCIHVNMDMEQIDFCLHRSLN